MLIHINVRAAGMLDKGLAEMLSLCVLVYIELNFLELSNGGYQVNPPPSFT